MAQGAFKQKKAAPPKKSNASGIGKGNRVIAPKKKKLIEQQKMAKKISAGLTAKTEMTLAERAGHLELLAGGKKSKKNDAAATAKAGKKSSGK